MTNELKVKVKTGERVAMSGKYKVEGADDKVDLTEGDMAPPTKKSGAATYIRISG